MSPPVDMVKEHLDEIGETTHNSKRREGLLWTRLRDFQKAETEYHAVEPDRQPSPEECVNLVRALCELAYTALETALLRGDDLRGYNLRPMTSITETRATIEQMLYDLFLDDEGSDSCYPIREAAAYYGFGAKLEACFAEVHRAKMAKIPCTFCDPKGLRCFHSKPTSIPDLKPILFGKEVIAPIAEDEPDDKDS